ILGRLDAAGHGAERQLHGEGRSVWPCFDLAAELGLMARLGLEDGTDLPDGRRADGNVALIRAGLARAARRA
ncbi:3-keto-5-aminohexanoate cleavage protein, partial [Roseomonas sp. DSM 102946]|nr:3-keto-5-aminohexanoate cleavage protein [Roseomonas sp. DSM 102946]